MYEIRPLTIRDYKGLMKCLKELSYVSGEDSFSEELFKITMLKRKYWAHTFVAVDFSSKEIIGTASVIIEPKFSNDFRPAAHLEDVAVLKSHQGTGIGKKLVEYIIGFAKKNNCYKIILDCDEKVVKFYNKLGFYLNGHAMRFDLK